MVKTLYSMIKQQLVVVEAVANNLVVQQEVQVVVEDIMLEVFI